MGTSPFPQTGLNVANLSGAGSFLSHSPSPPCAFFLHNCLWIVFMNCSVSTLNSCRQFPPPRVLQPYRYFHCHYLFWQLSKTTLPRLFILLVIPTEPSQRKPPICCCFCLPYPNARKFEHSSPSSSSKNARTVQSHLSQPFIKQRLGVISDSLLLSLLGWPPRDIQSRQLQMGDHRPNADAAPI